MAYQPIPTNTSGGQNRAEVTDSASTQLMEKLLTELRKMNLYLSLMTDTVITTDDVEER